MHATLTVNGREYTIDVPPRRTLADALREDCGLTGTHLGCEHGVCGACTVLVDGEAVRSCLMFAVQCGGRQIRTVEGLTAADGTDKSATANIDQAKATANRKFPLLGLVLSRYGLFELVFCPRRVVMCAHVLA